MSDMTQLLRHTEIYGRIRAVDFYRADALSADESNVQGRLRAKKIQSTEKEAAQTVPKAERI